MAERIGRVYLVGGGPGDPGLLTLRGKECLERADVIIYDRLIDPSLLRFAPTSAERIFVGKRADHHPIPQPEINALLVARAQAGQVVVRLKGGDPFVFGRGGEEAEALVNAGVPFEVVPGVTSAIAVPAYAGIPVTHRDYTSSFAVVTGHEEITKSRPAVDWERLAGIGTIVFLMGAGNLPEIVRQLTRHGRPASTPVAIIQWGTWSKQKTVHTTLADAVEKARAAQIGPPAITVVGEVAKLGERLRWFDNRPLFGKRVLITRTREQAGTLAALLSERGAVPVELPTIRIEPPTDWAAADRAIKALDQYAWAIFTSVNGVRAFFERLEARGYDLRALKGVRLAAIGPSTAAALAAYHLRVDFTPDEYVAEAVVEGMRQFALAGQRILLPRAQETREVLVIGLTDQGAIVDDVAVYQTRPTGDAAMARQLFEDKQVDVVTFTSSSTVRNLVALLGNTAPALLAGVTIASIGPITSQTARDFGLTVQVEAAEHTVPGLVAALEGAFSQ
jgi:uroporphyrinogen III methyltransferase/synthase